VGFIRRAGLSSQPVRSYLFIAAAIVIAGVLIAASVFIAVGEPAKTTTLVSTSILTQTGTTTSTLTSTATTISQRNITMTETSTQTMTITSLRNNTVTTTATTTVLSTMSFGYLTASGTVCMAGEAYAPCWGGGGNAPYVFNCLGDATSQQGCTQQVVDTTPPNGSYVINIRYPFSNQTQPSWSNCLWSIQGEMPGQGYAYCSLVGSNSFIMGEPAPALA
jgi:hypothetical protein